jgi:hypothetical protein
MGRLWLPPSLSHGESCEFVYVHGSSVHLKCFNHTLTNLLFSLCKFVWIINPLFIHLIPISELQHASLPPKCYELRSVPQFLLLIFPLLDSLLSLSRSVGVCHGCSQFKILKKFAEIFVKLKVKLFMLVVSFLFTWYCLKVVNVDDACPKCWFLDINKRNYITLTRVAKE